MFDWFRDMALEVTGKNSDKEELKRRPKREQEKKEKSIFSKSTKRTVYVLGILYLIMGGMSLYVSVQIANSTGYSDAGVGAWKYIKYAVLSSIDIAAMVCLLTKKRKMEIAAVVLVVAFIVFMYLSSIVFPFL